MIRLLIADDDRKHLKLLEKYFKQGKFDLYTASNLTHALNLINRFQFELVLTDLRMPNSQGEFFDFAGLKVLEMAKLSHPGVEVILMTAFAEIDIAVDAMKNGATDFLTKPFTIDQLEQKLKIIITDIEKSKENFSFQWAEIQDFTPYHFGSLLHSDPSMEEVVKRIKKISTHQDNVLITGETGTGKELVAREIHNHGNHEAEPFITVNCGALPEHLIESEFFGHEKGAFTGAVQKKIGKFELAKNGTLFLDEIGELPFNLQATLLRVLQFKTIYPVGGNEEINISARIIAATNRNLQKMVNEKKFRNDLFYRLKTFHINLPPLRKRKKDIALFVCFFLHKFSQELGKEVHTLDSNIKNFFIHYEWPGNIRELENSIRYALTSCESKVILPQDLPDDLLKEYHKFFNQESGFDQENQPDHKRKIIVELMAKHQGNVQLVARHLSVSDKTLYRRCKKLGINIKDFK